jgi:hypothetical protein
MPFYGIIFAYIIPYGTAFCQQQKNLFLLKRCQRYIKKSISFVEKVFTFDGGRVVITMMGSVAVLRMQIFPFSSPK